MKKILFGIYGIFILTAIITHIWTVVIAFQVSGMVGGILSLLLPGLSEIFWMFKMFGENNLYAVIALIHAFLALVYVIVGRE